MTKSLIIFLVIEIILVVLLSNKLYKDKEVIPMRSVPIYSVNK